MVGDTFEEAEQLIREGIVFPRDGLKEEGLPIPQPTTIAAGVSVAA